LHTTCGTLNYIAPEVIKNAGYEGHKADIWSCGVILYYMLAGCIFIWKIDLIKDLPFDDESLPKLIDRIVLAQFEFPAQFSADAKDLISNILTPNPNKRYSISQIKSHPWLKKSDSTFVTPPMSEHKNSMQLEKLPSKEFTDISPDEYIPAKMDAFEFASFCTGKLLNGLFELKTISASIQISEDTDAPPTEMVTNIHYKEYLPMV